MNLSEAKKIIGKQPKFAVRNMRRALEMAQWHNTDQDWQRLEACYVLMKTPHKKRKLKWPTSYAPYFEFIGGEMQTNNQRFATEQEAWDSASARFRVWTTPIDYHVKPSSDCVNYKFKNGKDISI